MKKSDLKRAIKPLVKECIHEVLIEEGLLSSVVAEVAKGLSASPIVEKRTQTKPKPPPQDDREMQRRNEDIKRKIPMKIASKETLKVKTLTSKSKINQIVNQSV